LILELEVELDWSGCLNPRFWKTTMGHRTQLLSLLEGYDAYLGPRGLNTPFQPRLKGMRIILRFTYGVK